MRESSFIRHEGGQVEFHATPKRFYNVSPTGPEGSKPTDVTQRLHVRSLAKGTRSTALMTHVDPVTVFEARLFQMMSEGGETDPAVAIQSAYEYAERHLARFLAMNDKRIAPQARHGQALLQQKVSQMMNEFSVPVGGSDPSRMTTTPRNAMIGGIGGGQITGVTPTNSVAKSQPKAGSMAQFHSCDGNVYEFVKTIVTPKGETKPSPSFFMDTLLLAFAEQAKGGDPLDILNQANFTFSDINGQVVHRFKPEPVEEAPENAPSNVSFDED